MKHKTQCYKSRSHLKHLMIVGLGLIVYGLLVFLSGNSSICVFKVHTGLPCPGCGMTRAMLSVLGADIQGAFWWHPLWPLVFLVPLGLWIVHKTGERGQRYKAFFLNAVLILVIGVYFIRMVFLFPHTAPMDFNNDAILFKFIRYLGRF